MKSTNSFRNISGIYKITNKINNKSYIGQSTKVKNRIAVHRRAARTLVISKAILKYGVDNFEFEVLLYCEIHELDRYEKELIGIYNTASPNGYNIELGGHENKVVSEETKKKLSEQRKGWYVGEKNPFYGKKHNEESKRIMSETHKGKIISDEHKKIISEISKLRKGILSPSYGKKGEACPAYGRKLSDEAKRKISESRIGAKNPNSKKVKINGITYDTIVSAAIALNINTPTVTYRLKSKKQKYSDYILL